MRAARHLRLGVEELPRLGVLDEQLRRRELLAVLLRERVHLVDDRLRADAVESSLQPRGLADLSQVYDPAQCYSDAEVLHGTVN